MIKPPPLLIDKKSKYLIYSGIVAAALFYSSAFTGNQRLIVELLAFCVAVVGSFIIQRPNVKLNNLIYIVMLPVYLFFGAALSLRFFPNLGLPTKIAAVAGVGLFLYIVSLVNNVLLVVQDRDQMIPLHRAALTWSYIILVVIGIPFYAGVFKIPLIAPIQNFIAAGTAFLFSTYLLWGQQMDPDISKIGIGERVKISLLGSFFVFSLGMSVSFVPTESFLRALFVASVLMFELGYLQAHFKNSITNKMLREFGMICGLFLLLLLIFNP